MVRETLKVRLIRIIGVHFWKPVRHEHAHGGRIGRDPRVNLLK